MQPLSQPKGLSLLPGASLAQCSQLTVNLHANYGYYLRIGTDDPVEGLFRIDMLQRYTRPRPADRDSILGWVWLVREFIEHVRIQLYCSFFSAAACFVI